MRDRGLEAQALEALGLVESSRGDHESAAAQLGRAAAARRAGGRPACRTEQLVVDRTAEVVRRHLGRGRFDELVAAAGAAATG